MAKRRSEPEDEYSYNYTYEYSYSEPNAMRPRKTRSIARSINRDFSARVFSIFLLMDAIIFGPELMVLLRELTSGAAAFNFDPLISAMHENRVILGFQGVVWVFTLFTGVGGIRRKLKPLDDITSAASFFTSQSAAADETRLHDLESAIDSISPTNEDAALRTGDKELAGLEQAVNKLIKRMRDSYRQQARFVSDASHELRTPIAVIQGYANMLDRWGKEDEKVLTESIDAIKAESEHMKKLVEQLLFLARGDSGRTQLNVENIDLSGMMSEVLEESEMIDRDHVYCLKAEEPVLTIGDPDMLKQTARILVDNAVKYSPAGETITLRTGYMDGYPTFTVQDNGRGMAQSDVPHVFERFYRADSSRARESGGTGLGLAIAKWIVDRHGGWFVVVSREELGTRITVCLQQRPEFDS